ncbi:hypothetical protein IWQ57_003015, partial [Coemansia nantahalensis]
ADGGARRLLAAMHCTADGGGTVFVASVAQPGQALLITRASGGGERAAVARVELAIDACGPAKAPVTVTGLSFFDDELLGVAFTIEGRTRPFLGAVDYRPGAGVLAYSPAAADCDAGTASPLEFVRVQLLANASAERPVALASNGATGRRCVAVVEQRGRAWWPYDMDNEEEEDDEMASE